MPLPLRPISHGQGEKATLILLPLPISLSWGQRFFLLSTTSGPSLTPPRAVSCLRLKLNLTLPVGTGRPFSSFMVSSPKGQPLDAILALGPWNSSKTDSMRSTKAMVSGSLGSSRRETDQALGLSS